ncbi:hypothetical protein TH5_00685 [Thalassospira xianhensis MCCC 1A02616]|uniref:Uncharacterized protein n=1 Tax=Thalassospira xianhensis MCCC 1A02616 TaxID=1177929 RepID=A0A367UH35_9PROT|nr:hypothetical protein TH5_00685 [Thalassospira xianhensis MCCC 1A02616]
MLLKALGCVMRELHIIGRNLARTRQLETRKRLLRLGRHLNERERVLLIKLEDACDDFETANDPFENGRLFDSGDEDVPEVVECDGCGKMVGRAGRQDWIDMTWVASYCHLCVAK